MRHSARGQNMQNSTVDVMRCVKPQAIIASEGNKRRSGKFFITGGPVLASCKTPLTRKAQARSCLYFRKTKSDEHICSNTPAQLQSDGCVRVVPPFRTKFLSTAFKQWGSSAMPLLRCLNKDLVVALSSLHTNRNKLKGSEDFN